MKTVKQNFEIKNNNKMKNNNNQRDADNNQFISTTGTCSTTVDESVNWKWHDNDCGKTPYDGVKNEK
jgi:hypothetical protein